LRGRDHLEGVYVDERGIDLKEIGCEDMEQIYLA
jgi:hypothetical protein